VGAKNAMEEELIPKEGFPLETVTAGSFRRKLGPAFIKHNLRTLYRLQKSRIQVKAILDRFQPDLVVGTGGYASYPVVRAAAARGIPTAIHESNVVPGLTTRRLSKYVDCIMVGMPEAQNHYDHPERVVVTGTPVRGAFWDYSRKEAKAALHIPEEQPLLLSYWGSLGADQMNRYMVDFIQLETEEQASFAHIHGAGHNYGDMLQELEDRGVTLLKQCRIERYIHNMPLVMAAADLVLCRAGASTISELTALGKPAIIVPSPNVTGNHQEKNAAALALTGGAVMILESDCDGARLYREASMLLRENRKRVVMEKAMAATGKPDAGDQIYQTLIKLLQKG
ncbi:MAG: undecaprenyldiphospho-muramoylpentapeptide beta-N-acetylglucosaminyltransferase, partial [Firmicutes bacterium]|nr:undecaprenyldiphospho-muramoylpentapeptide beta-N-acetylglucosaminyltransferase [Bacillota bacterium]